VISVRGQDDRELLYNDYVRNIRPGSGIFGLVNDLTEFYVDDGSIIVKDGRLVSAGSISNQDQVYVVANRKDATGRIKAEVVFALDRINPTTSAIYRGRITRITEGRQFTLESFSELVDTQWNFANTPKTLAITYDTRLLDEDGLLSTREFFAYGPDSFIGRTVYVVADGNDAKLISTAPYGLYNFRGIINRLEGIEYDEEEGERIGGPDGVWLVEASAYSRTSNAWVNSRDLYIDFELNTIFIKNGEVVEPDVLRRGDTLRVIKRDDTLSGIAYIVFVEE